MWHRLPGLVLCGTTALWADVCQGLPPAPSESAADGHRSGAFRLLVKPGEPAFRITIRPIPIESQAQGIFVHAGDIEVVRCQDGTRLQLIALMAWQFLYFASSFNAQDVNFDGYLDFAVLAEFGGTWGSEWWWVYDPTAGRFVQNELTRDLRGLKAAEYHIDPKKQEIMTRYLTEPWGCGSTGDHYRVANSRLMIVHKELPKPAKNECSVIVSDLVGGTMRVTSVRRFVDGRRVK